MCSCSLVASGRAVLRPRLKDRPKLDHRKLDVSFRFDTFQYVSIVWKQKLGLEKLAHVFQHVTFHNWSSVSDGTFIHRISAKSRRQLGRPLCVYRPCCTSSRIASATVDSHRGRTLSLLSLYYYYSSFMSLLIFNLFVCLFVLFIPFWTFPVTPRRQLSALVISQPMTRGPGSPSCQPMRCPEIGGAIFALALLRNDSWASHHQTSATKNH